MRKLSLRNLAVAVVIPALAMWSTAVRADHDAGDGDKVTITIAQLPQAVLKTLTREAQGGKVGDIDLENENGVKNYEVDINIGGKPYELKIALDGTLLKKDMDAHHGEDGDNNSDKCGDHDQE